MDCIQSTKDVGDFMRLRAYAKINLGLDILGKRSDGYHEVKMIMHTIQMYDLLEIKKISRFHLKFYRRVRYMPNPFYL